FPQAPAHAVAHHGLADLAAHHAAHADLPVPGLAPTKTEVLATTGLPLAKPLERAVPRERPQDRVGVQRSDTESRLRPLARRRLMTLRPPGVAIRARNPCVLARLRRLGW